MAQARKQREGVGLGKAVLAHMPVDEVHQRCVVGNDALGFTGAARGEGDVGRLLRADSGQRDRLAREGLQRLRGGFRHRDDHGLADVDGCLGTAQYHRRLQGVDDLLDTRGRVSGVSHGEGQAGTQAAEHGVYQGGAAAGDDDHTIGAAGGVFNQKRGNARADLLQLGVVAGCVLANDGNGRRAAAGLLDESVVNGLFGTVLQAQRRVRAQVRHDDRVLRRNVGLAGSTTLVQAG